METFSALLALCEGNPPVTGGFPSQRPVTRSFDVFFDLNIRLGANDRYAGDLRRHCAHYDVTVIRFGIFTLDLCRGFELLRDLMVRALASFWKSPASSQVARNKWLGLALLAKRWGASYCRLIHSPSLVAIGLSVGYIEHGLPLAAVADFVIGWSKYRLEETSIPLDSGKLWAHMTGGNFHRFADATDSPFTCTRRRGDGETDFWVAPSICNTYRKHYGPRKFWLIHLCLDQGSVDPVDDNFKNIVLLKTSYFWHNFIEYHGHGSGVPMMICHRLRWWLGLVREQLYEEILTWAPSQYPKRRIFVRSREVSKPRDWYFKLSHRFEIWQAHRQQCCRSACQISERSGNSKCKSRGFEMLRKDVFSDIETGPWAPSEYPKRRLFVTSRKVSKPRDRYFKLTYRLEIWQAHRQHCCRSAVRAIGQF